MKSIEEFIQDRVEEFDVKELVLAEIRSLIQDDIKRTIQAAVKKEIDDLIHSEVEIYMAGTVTTDDGWGKRESFPSLKDLFMRTFKERLDKSYEMRNSIAKAVKNKVDELYQQNAKIISEKFAKELTNMVK